VPDACSVALVDRQEMPPAGWASLLSDRERAEASTYRHPVRRARTMTSRVLAKYLVIRPEASGFRRLSAREIAPVRDSEWTSVELLSGTAGARGRATVFRDGLAFSDLSVSSSHCGTQTAACLSRGWRVGLDLERIEPRRQEFYANTFSAEERNWVEGMRPCAGASTGAAFTLLWSIKEAYLKASGRPDISVWTFPRWTVRFDGAVDRMLRPEGARGLVRISGGIHSHGFSQAVDIAGMRVGDMILAAVQYQESDTLALQCREANDE
jgi:phosphopantetheinyl transferase